MRDRSTDLIFSATSTGPDGAFFEVTIDEGVVVHYSFRENRKRPVRSEQIEKRRRDVDELLWKIEELGVKNWQRAYGSGDAWDAGGWMVLLEINRDILKWQGCGEHPAEWGEMCALLAEFLGRPFG